MADTNVNDTEQCPDGDEGDDLEQIYKGVLSCEAAIRPEDVDTLAALLHSNEKIGRSWRLTAVIASKDGSLFRQVSENQETAKVLASLITPLQDFAATLRMVADLTDCAVARVAVAGCNHEHFNRWIEESA